MSRGGRKHLIIGCGAAALSAACRIRKVAPDDEVKLVTKEEHPPYNLAALPYLISGKTREPDLWQVGEDRLRRAGCSLAKGREVIGLQPEEKQVIYRDGGREGYDTLLIATGSHPVEPDIEGLGEAGFLSFHTLEDCRALQRRLADGSEMGVAIYGGGLVAVELAIALLEAGHRVKVIVRSRPLRRYFSEDEGSLIETILTERGAEIYKGSGIEEARGERGKGAIELALSDGRSLEADLLVAALGVRPATSFLEGTGIELGKGGGVLVDRRMRTNLEDVYAAGDVAAAPDLFSGSPGLSAILPSAIEQGRVAGSNMAGEGIEYEGWVPMNILNLFGHRTLSIGVQEDGEAQVLKEIDRQRRHFKRLVYKDGRLIGAAFLNSDVFPGVVQYLVRKKVEVGKYAELLLRRPKETSAWLMLRAEREETLSLEA